jgi:hypothetical protein
MTLNRPQQNKGKKIAISASAENARIDYNREKPTFCLRFVDTQYCITACDRDDKAALADKMRRMSCMTWNEIIQAPRHGMGFETISRDVIRRPIPAHITDDVTLIAFRFSGLKPMVGYRVNGMFHVIWFDCRFDLYPHD